MIKAVYENTVIAESERAVEIEGHCYFPIEDVHLEYLKFSSLHRLSALAGLTYFYSVVVHSVVENGAWYYPEPKPNTAYLRDHIAFRKNVQIVKS